MKSLGMKLSGLAFLLAAQGAAAYDYNVDLRNTGTTTAYDVAVVLDGAETVTNTFDGYGSGAWDGYFYDVSNQPTADGNTVIHWQNMWGNNSPIPPGDQIHVGWSTSDCHSTIKDMYWTSKTGGRIRGSVILNVSTGISYPTPTRPVIRFDHIYATEVAVRMELTNVRFAVVNQGLSLEGLTSANQELMAQLRPLGQGRFTLDPGQSISLDVPATVNAGQALVVVYDTGATAAKAGLAAAAASASSALATHFTQVVNRPNNPCP
ncbi:hypothetical protein KRR26_23680 [Corallococcus sp. M34]|uniref:hypothetical protein n=1 Tax=Citreicoccus inhibens TaxID=2849499 RepID=UPI001C217385|nr:hypothetical protein [Citreicoccus inhibens]MBU8898616.1 hypothetical protein [Citreicoccus inhibens]